MYEDEKGAFGTIKDVPYNVIKSGTFFLLCCRETRANKYTNEYKMAETEAQKKKVAELNKKGVLEWHSSALFYKEGKIFYYDVNFDYDEFNNREMTTRDLGMSGRLRDFVAIIKKNNANKKKKKKISKSKNERIQEKKMPIFPKIFVTGPTNSETDGNCRVLAMKFIVDAAIAHIQNQPLTAYKFKQVHLGPRKPGACAVLEEIDSVNLKAI